MLVLRSLSPSAWARRTRRQPRKAGRKRPFAALRTLPRSLLPALYIGQYRRTLADLAENHFCFASAYLDVANPSPRSFKLT